MAHDDAFLWALAITLGGSLVLTIHLHRPLKRLLLQVCDCPERSVFWLSCIDLILMLVPLVALFMARHSGQSYTASAIMAVVDLLSTALIGVLIAIFVVIFIVMILTNVETTWEAKIVPKDQRDDLKRLLSKVDSMRAAKSWCGTPRRKRRRRCRVKRDSLLFSPFPGFAGRGGGRVLNGIGFHPSSGDEVCDDTSITW